MAASDGRRGYCAGGPAAGAARADTTGDTGDEVTAPMAQTGS